MPAAGGTGAWPRAGCFSPLYLMRPSGINLDGCITNTGPTSACQNGDTGRSALMHTCVSGPGKPSRMQWYVEYDVDGNNHRCKIN